MGTFLLSTICALAFNFGAFQAKPDTTNIYIIDKATVQDFNGSQLEGKKIISYNIETAPSDNDPNKILRIHVISTDQNEKRQLYVVNNTVYTQEEFDKIKEYLQIESLAVFHGVKSQAKYAETHNIKDLEIDDSKTLIVIGTKKQKNK